MKQTLHTIVLTKGTKILFVNVPDSRSYYFNSVCNAGFNYADRDKYELPHLLEHLAFEGSKGYPKKGEMAYALEMIGGYNNAYTSEDTIRYYLVGSIDDYIKLTKIALDQYTLPLFRQASITEQKRVVERELMRDIDDDGSKVRALNYSKLFPDKVVFAQDRIATIAAITRADILAYYKATHTQANSYFVIAGDLPASTRDAITKLIERYIAVLPDGTSLNKHKSLSSSYNRLIQSLPSKLKGQMYFAIAFIGPEYNPDIRYRAARIVASAIYNRGDGSRIFSKARAAGVAYSVNSGISMKHDYSELYIIEKTDPHLAAKLFELCIKELIDIKNGNITTEELNRAKGYMAGDSDTEYETSRELADWYGPMFVYDEDTYSPQDFSTAIRAVTKADVVAVLNKFVQKDSWILSLVGHGASAQKKKFQAIIDKYL